MALSNWDTLALDQDGQPSDGTYTSAAGVEVVIYKNWVYVRDPASWREGCRFSEPTVMEIHEGKVSYLDVYINAVRGPQEGIYVLVADSEWKPTSLMVGCGVYGWQNGTSDQEAVWLGVQPSSVVALQAHLNTTGPSPYALEVHKAEYWHQEEMLRFNQGDAYIAAQAGVEGVPATAPGEADEPMFTAAWKDVERDG